MKKQVRELIESDLKNFEDAHKFTQFVRGELYFYIDSLISLYNSSSIEELPEIFDFMQEYFKLVLKWMEIFPSYLKNVTNFDNHLSSTILCSTQTYSSLTSTPLFPAREEKSSKCWKSASASATGAKSSSAASTKSTFLKVRNATPTKI